MKASFFYHPLQFIRPGGTSRGVLKSKDSWFVKLERGGQFGIGECSIIEGLSVESKSAIDAQLEFVCDSINQGAALDTLNLKKFPAIQFALEMASLSLHSDDAFLLFNNAFYTGSGIPINGLVWMGSRQFMFDQIKEKIEGGFRCIKMKIAAIDFEEELALIRYIRSQFTEDDMQIRVDANGGFSIDDAMDRLSRLRECGIHSIEQPIAIKQWEEMSRLCESDILPIALDEELIGVFEDSEKSQMLSSIRPHYIILKPSLVGGFKASDDWIEKAENQGIGWWATSALESNIGLNAIAQWVYQKDNSMYQGLGTGQLFSNNVDSPLDIQEAELVYKHKRNWDLEFFKL